MEVTFYGHNCFFLKGENVIVISDPWLSEEGAFYGSWYQWPVNHHLKPKLLQDLKTDIRRVLYISHEHQDHFDKVTLEHIRPYFDECIIPKYEDKYLYENLCELGYHPLELEDTQRHYFDDKDYIEILIVDTGVNHDSTALVSIDGKNFLNQNDCKIFDRLPYFQDVSIDYYAVQFSGATWHPVCFEFSESNKADISRQKVKAKAIAIRNAIKLIKPRFYLPSAGPAIFPFLCDDLSLGNENIFVHQPEIYKYLKNSEAEIIFLRPGETLQGKKSYNPVEPPTVADLVTLRSNLTCVFTDIEDSDFSPTDIMAEVTDRLQQIRDIRFGNCPLILFDWGDGGIEIDLQGAAARYIVPETYRYPEEYLKISATKAYFSLMGNPKHRWQDIALSLRASIKREPDVVNTFANIFLFSDKGNIRSGFKTTLDIKEERILIINPVDGRNYEIDRYCPHNGADLKDARVDRDGNLICPRHSWLFSLENGGNCLTASASLNANEVLKTISICDSISARLLKLNE